MLLLECTLRIRCKLLIAMAYRVELHMKKLDHIKNNMIIVPIVFYLKMPLMFPLCFTLIGKTWALESETNPIHVY
jgi:hypothetical protein